jgi:hypothetical protein
MCICMCVFVCVCVCVCVCVRQCWSLVEENTMHKEGGMERGMYSPSWLCVSVKSARVADHLAAQDV